MQPVQQQSVRPAVEVSGVRIDIDFVDALGEELSSPLSAAQLDGSQLGAGGGDG